MALVITRPTWTTRASDHSHANRDTSKLTDSKNDFSNTLANKVDYSQEVSKE